MTGDAELSAGMLGRAEWLCRALDASPIGYAVVGADGVCIAANRTLVRWSGDAASLRGRTAVDPQHAQLFKHFMEALRGVPQEFETSRPPLAQRRGRRFAVSIVPSGVEDLEAVLISLEDVTRHAAARRAFHASESRYRMIVDAMTDGVVIHREGRALYVNPAAKRIVGARQSDELVGRQIADFVHPDSAALVAERLETVERVGRVPPVQEMFVRVDGDPVPVEVSAFRVPLDDGMATFTFFRDISQRLQLQSELEKSSRMESLGRLAGAISHDFNNVLQGVRGGLTLALKTHDLAEVRSNVATAQAAADRASDLVRQLLVFSRGGDVELRPVDVNRVVSEAIELVKRLDGPSANISAALGPDVVPALLDPSQLHQVMLNLLVNARDAVGADGSISITTSSYRVDDEEVTLPARPGNWVMVTVSDDGPGMDAAVRARIFEPFFTTKADSGGSGLGLSTVYGILRRAGGWISVNSAPGQGTTFVVALPVAEQPSDPDEQATDRSSAAGLRVALCDDEARLAQLTARLLSDHGLDCEVFTTGAALLNRLRSTRLPDVILLDVRLSDVDATWVLEHMDAERLDVPVVLTSGYAQDDLPPELSQHPRVKDYAAKPYHADTLAGQLRGAVGSMATRSGGHG